MRESMEIYPRTAAERAMKLHEVLLRATTGKIKWWQAAELMGIEQNRWQMRSLAGAAGRERAQGLAGPSARNHRAGGVRRRRRPNRFWPFIETSTSI